MKKVTDPDSQLLADIQEYDEKVISTYAKRDTMIKRLDEMYLLEWDETPSTQEIKLTKSPDARNTVQGVVRLMTATMPHFSVPSATNDDQANANNETMELAAEALWAASNQVQQVTVERDVAQSLTLYDEGYISITSMADLSAAIKKREGSGKLSWLNDHIHGLVDEVPYLYTPISPAEAYPMVGRTGMIAYVQKQNVTVSELLERFGDLATDAVGSRKPFHTVEVREHWDAKYHAVYLQGGGEKKKILLDEHGLDFIPVSMRIANGTRLFREPERQRQPMLYTLYQSGLWRDKNAILTAAMNRLRAIGLNAQFVHRRGSADATVELDFSAMGGVINLAPGSDLRLLADALIDNNTMAALNLVDGMISDSTIYKQALGAPVSGPTAYATISLLSQAGRLPLVPIQEAAEDLLSRTMQLTMKWIKLSGEQATAYKARDKVLIDPAQFPDRVVFSTRMDVDLPQDTLRNANIATMLKQAGLVDDRWIHENVLKIGQTTDMKKRIVAQQVSELLIQNTVQKFMEQWQKQTTQPKTPAAPTQTAVGAGANPPAASPQMAMGAQGQGFDPNAGGMATAEAMGAPSDQMPPEMMAQMMGGPQGGGQ